MQLLLSTLVISSSLIIGVFSVECFTGLQFLSGQGAGANTINCGGAGAQCYNMTASGAGVLNVVKTGCSLWRCMFARDRCISTTFKNIPISLCCCSGNRCNAGNMIENKGNFVGVNAEPDAQQRKQMEEAMRQFGDDIDDDNHFKANRGDRQGGWN